MAYGAIRKGQDTRAATKALPPLGAEPLYHSGTSVLAAALRVPGLARLKPPPRSRMFLRSHHTSGTKCTCAPISVWFTVAVSIRYSCHVASSSSATSPLVNVQTRTLRKARPAGLRRKSRRRQPHTTKRFHECNDPTLHARNY